MKVDPKQLFNLMDEAPEVFTKLKTLAQEAPEELQKLLKSLKGEAVDATPKLGQGKNLEALQKARESIVDAQRVQPKPSYPSQIIQDELASSSKRGKGFKLEGDPYSKEGVMVPEGSQPPAIRKQTMPEVIETTGKLVDDVPSNTISKVDDVMEAMPKSADNIVETATSKVDDVMEAMPKSADNITETVASKVDDVMEAMPKSADDITETVASKVDDVIETMPAASMPSKSSKLATTAKIAAGVGGAGALYNALKTDENELQKSPQVTQQIQANQVAPIEVEPIKQSQEKSMGDAQKMLDQLKDSQIVAPVSPQMPVDKKEAQPKMEEAKPITEDDKQKVIEIGKKMSESPESITKEEIDYVKMLKSAQQDDSQSKFITGLLRAGTALGAAIAGVKPDYTLVDSLEKSINKEANVKKLMEADVAQKKFKNEMQTSEAQRKKYQQDLLMDQQRLDLDKQKYDRQYQLDLSEQGIRKEQNELNTKKVLSDINTNTKRMELVEKELADKAKMDDPNSEISKMSRDLFRQAGYNISDTVSASNIKSAGYNVSEMLIQKQKNEAAASAEALKEIKNTKAFITGARTQLKPAYEKFQKVNSTYQTLEKLANNPSIKPGTKDIAMMYEFIKNLDTTSAVREGEIALMKQGYSRAEAFELNFKKIINSDILNPSFRQSMVDIAKIKRDQVEQEYRELSNTYRNDAVNRGLDEDQMKQFDFMSANQPKEKEQPQESSGFVQIQRISDGEVRTLPASSIKNMDKTKYRIIGQ